MKKFLKRLRKKILLKKVHIRFGKIQYGFTMIEILISASILALLGVGGIGAYSGHISRSHDARRLADLSEVAIGIEEYYNDNFCYPDENEIVFCGGSLAPYLPQLPCDPSNNGDNIYYYEKLDCRSFRLYTNLNSGSYQELVESSGCGAGCGPGGNFNFQTSSGDAVTEGNEEGVDPTCGSVTKWCPAGTNECGVCCPGDNYICNGSGTRCISSPQCGN